MYFCTGCGRHYVSYLYRSRSPDYHDWCIFCVSEYESFLFERVFDHPPKTLYLRSLL